MTVRDEIKGLVDKLPESGLSLHIAKDCIQSLLLQNEAEDRFRKERSETQLGRSGWSGVHNGFHVAGHSVHCVQNNELIAQTLYSYDGHQVEITEKFSYAARETKLLCRLFVSSGGVTLHHDDEFSLPPRPSRK